MTSKFVEEINTYIGIEIGKDDPAIIGILYVGVIIECVKKLPSSHMCIKF